MSMIMANYFRVGDGTAGDGGDTQNRRRPWPRKEPATGDRRRRVDIPAVFPRPGLRVHGDITGHLGNKKTADATVEARRPVRGGNVHVPATTANRAPALRKFIDGRTRRSSQVTAGEGRIWNCC
jgi:hypothetical protein